MFSAETAGGRAIAVLITPLWKKGGEGGFEKVQKISPNPSFPKRQTELEPDIFIIRTFPPHYSLWSQSGVDT